MMTYLDHTSTQSSTLEQMKDEEILKASGKEPALFSLLVERYQEPLLRAALRVVRNRQEAEDIVQEAFVKMYTHADAFQKLEGIGLKSWAYKIVINTAITHYRKLKRPEFLSEDPSVFEPPEEFADTDIFAATDARHAVAATLEKLPEHLGVALKSYYLEDKSYRTIAQEQKISIPTLKMRLFRAKRVFKKLVNFEL